MYCTMCNPFSQNLKTGHQAVRNGEYLRTSNGEPERALSVAMALDLSPTDELAMVPRDLWRSVEPSLDICVNFCDLS